MYLHYHCQIKLIHEKGEKCSVCLEEFNNVDVYTKVKYVYSWQTKSAFIMIILDVGIGAMGLYEIYLFSFSNGHPLFILIMGNIFLLMSFILGIMMYRTLKQLRVAGRYYEIKSERIINLKI
jgi:hypothetical protein|tara:strand:+ start:2141 stop:2506 length:366 start_codon:yes stop_codon:yes gene_type:complete